MSLSNEIKSLLTLGSRNRVDLSEFMGLAQAQSLNNKFNRESWSAEDLYKVLTFLGGQVVLKVDDREIVLTKKHFEKKSKPKPVESPKLDLDSLLTGAEDGAPVKASNSRKRIKLE